MATWSSLVPINMLIHMPYQLGLCLFLLSSACTEPCRCITMCGLSCILTSTCNRLFMHSPFLLCITASFKCLEDFSMWKQCQYWSSHSSECAVLGRCLGSSLVKPSTVTCGTSTLSLWLENLSISSFYSITPPGNVQVPGGDWRHGAAEWRPRGQGSCCRQDSAKRVSFLAPFPSCCSLHG